MEITTVVIDWIRLLCPAAFSALLAWVIASKKTHTEDKKHQDEENKAFQKAIADGVRSLLRKNIVDAYELYVVHHSPLTVERYHELDAQHSAYKGLNGNGTVDHMWDELSCIDLHIVKTQATD